MGALLRRAAATGRPICAYGEMVALLWDAGRVPAAIELEVLWNELRREVPCSLYCAYPSESVSGADQADALRDVCCLHSAVVDRDARQGDVGRGSAAVTGMARDLPAERDAPGAARRFVVDELRAGGYAEDRVHDAALVVTEMAANALVHARSAFTVAVTSEGGAVRISVNDASPVLPARRDEVPMAQSGRGLVLVPAIARTWGADRTDDG